MAQVQADGSTQVLDLREQEVELFAASDETVPRLSQNNPTIAGLNVYLHQAKHKGIGLKK